MKVLCDKLGGRRAILGMHLLAICEILSASVVTEKPLGEGAIDNPFVPVKRSHWAWCWKNTNREVAYYRIGGRLIFRDTRHYVSDVERANFVEDDKAHRALINNPTYVTIRDVFERGEEVDMQTTFSSPNVSSQFANIIEGRYSETNAIGAGTDSNLLAMARYLPIASAAMLISEPARNKRAWPINLMIIDMMKNEVWKKPWSQIFWHPLGGRAMANLPFFDVETDIKGNRKDIMGPATIKNREVGVVQTGSDIHLVGGMMPASPTEGGARGKFVLVNNPEPEKYSFARNTRLDFVHEKEMQVMFDWFQNHSGIRQNWSVVEVPNSGLLHTKESSRGYYNFEDLRTSATGPFTELRAAISGLIS
jgi:hypothetical protein